MAKINARITKELYKIEIKSPSGNMIIADEPLDVGGKNLGFAPKELLASALAACTTATLRMYADHKKWDLQEVKLEITLEQKTRLIGVANACPVHKILTNPIEIINQ